MQNGVTLKTPSIDIKRLPSYLKKENSIKSMKNYIAVLEKILKCQRTVIFFDKCGIPSTNCFFVAIRIGQNHLKHTHRQLKSIMSYAVTGNNRHCVQPTNVRCDSQCKYVSWTITIFTIIYVVIIAV